MKYRVKFEIHHEHEILVDADGVGKAIAAARDKHRESSCTFPLGSVIGVERVD